jgi:predicted DCC family thiol-disulfide oxidoreductase YuxK
VERPRQFASSSAAIGDAGDASVETIYYDGHCGLCHGFVRFVLARDAAGARFRFAPLEGETFAARRAEAERALGGPAPDSVLVEGAAGAWLVRSAAVLHVLRRLGPGWRLMAWLARVAPRRLRDRIYDGVAAVRRRLFGRPIEACPIVPPDLRGRFKA